MTSTKISKETIAPTGAASLAASCCLAPALFIATHHPVPAKVVAHSKSKIVVFHVDGMTCTPCKHAVEKALGSVAGVEPSDVDASNS